MRRKLVQERAKSRKGETKAKKFVKNNERLFKVGSTSAAPVAWRIMTLLVNEEISKRREEEDDDYTIINMDSFDVFEIDVIQGQKERIITANRTHEEDNLMNYEIIKQKLTKEIEDDMRVVNNYKQATTMLMGLTDAIDPYFQKAFNLMNPLAKECNITRKIMKNDRKQKKLFMECGQMPGELFFLKGATLMTDVLSKEKREASTINLRTTQGILAHSHAYKTHTNRFIDGLDELYGPGKNLFADVLEYKNELESRLDFQESDINHSDLLNHNVHPIKEPTFVDNALDNILGDHRDIVEVISGSKVPKMEERLREDLSVGDGARKVRMGLNQVKNSVLCSKIFTNLDNFTSSKIESNPMIKKVVGDIKAQGLQGNNPEEQIANLIKRILGQKSKIENSEIFEGGEGQGYGDNKEGFFKVGEGEEGMEDSFDQKIADHLESLVVSENGDFEEDKKNILPKPEINLLSAPSPTPQNPSKQQPSNNSAKNPGSESGIPPPPLLIPSNNPGQQNGLPIIPPPPPLKTPHTQTLPSNQPKSTQGTNPSTVKPAASQKSIPPPPPANLLGILIAGGTPPKIEDNNNSPIRNDDSPTKGDNNNSPAMSDNVDEYDNEDIYDGMMEGINANLNESQDSLIENPKESNKTPLNLANSPKKGGSNNAKDKTPLDEVDLLIQNIGKQAALPNTAQAQDQNPQSNNIPPPPPSLPGYIIPTPNQTNEPEGSILQEIGQKVNQKLNTPQKSEISDQDSKGKRERDFDQNQDSLNNKNPSLDFNNSENNTN